MNLHVLLLIIFLLINTRTPAQNQFTSQPVIWFTATEQLLFNDTWNVKLNIQQRQFTKTPGSFQFIASSTIDRKFNEKLSAGIGFMFFDFRLVNPADGNLVDLPELRPYEYVTFRYVKNKLKFFNRLLVEQRFQKHLASEGTVTQNYHLNHRIRLKWQASIPIGKKFSLIISDEPMIYFGPDIEYNTFDQNRLIIMGSYKLRENLTLGTGYMNWIFQRSNVDSFDIRHVWLVEFRHSLPL